MYLHREWIAEKTQEEKKKDVQLPLVVLYGSNSLSLYSTDSPWLNEISLVWFVF